MTVFEWGMLSVAVLGFLITAGSVLGGCVWAVAKINMEVSARIDQERISTDQALKDLAADFAENQRTQDHNFGEMGSALRRFIESVEKEMHKIEMWGRDHYAQKPEVEKAIGALREDIKAGFTEIKNDIRALSTKVDSKH
jgi:hypothetical protein